MKSPRSQAKRHTYAFPWFLDLSDDPVFEGCLARELNSPGSARWIWGQPRPPPASSNIIQYYPASRTTPPQTLGTSLKNRLWAQLDPHKRSGHPSKIASWPQDGPRWPSDGSKMAQDDPKMAQDGSKMAQDGPKMAPRWPKIAPRWPKKDPRWLKMAPRWPKMAARWPKMAPS